MAKAGWEGSERVRPGILNQGTAAAILFPLRSEIMAAGGRLMVTVGLVQLRHEMRTEVDLAATSFKAAIALTPGARSADGGLRQNVGRDIGHAIEPVPILAVFPKAA